MNIQHYTQETSAQLYRWMRRLRREPVTVVFALFQPLIWLLLFSGVFKRVTDVSGMQGDSYTAFLAPGAVALTVFGNSMAAGIPILFDREYGYLNRLLAAPIARSSIIISRFLFVTALSMVQSALILGIAGLMGVSPAAGAGGVLVILLLGAVYGLGITALSLALAFIFHSHVEYFALMSMLTLPMLFISTALAPPAMMHDWLQAVVYLNPMTWAVDPMRSLVLDGWDWPLILKSTALLIVFDLLALGGATMILRKKMGQG